MRAGGDGPGAGASLSRSPSASSSSSPSPSSIPTGKVDRLPNADHVRRVVATMNEPNARAIAQINEASTRLHAALRRLREGVPAAQAMVEPLERRGLLSAAAFDAAADAGDASAPPAYAAELASPAPSGRPSVTSTSPASGATGVLRDTFVSANLSVPSGGIDTTTLSPATVKLFRSADGALVAASVNTSAGGDVLVLGPSAPLEPDTEYTFEVTEGLRDVGGDAFLPFVTRFRTGLATSASDSSLKFTKHTLAAVPKAPYTGVTKGPDGRLYAAVETGEIVRFDIRPDGNLANPQTIRSLIEAHGGASRFLTGIEFDPASTAGDLVLWATHSHYAIDNGPDWAGKVTRLSGPDLATVQDYVVGLPRSTRDHVTNQLKFGPDGAIYFPQASNTAMGAPDYAWHHRPERYLSASILRLDVGLVRDRLAAGGGPLDVKTEEGGTYNPHAPGAPLTLFASGVRNAYDLLWHSNGHLYAPMNGSQRGGATPAGKGTPAIAFVDQVENDYLFDVQTHGYYGHPNPSRGYFTRNGGNPTAGADPFELPQYPVGTQPDANYRRPAYDFGQHYSPNGVIEYRGQAFGGTLQGKILVARYSGGDDIMVLTVNNEGQVLEAKGGLEGLKNFNDPLDLTEDLATGFLYVVEFGGQRITLVKPAVHGTPPGNPAPPLRAPLGPWGLSARPAGKGALELTWTDTVGETSYKVERSLDGASWTQVASVPPNQTRYLDAGLARDTKYSYRVRAANVTGFSKFSNGSSAKTLAVTLPDGWTGADVGAVGRAGTGDFRDGAFEIAGSGADVAGGADAFFFASTPATGDVEVVARVTGVGHTNPFAKAGVMIRAGTGANAANAMMELTAAHGAEFQARSAAGGETAHVSFNTGGGSSVAAPFWVRLVRRGDTVSGYASPDGENWVRVGFMKVAMGEQVLVGLAVTAHDAAALCTATFDNVRIGGAPAPAAPDAPADLAAAVAGTRVDLSWRDTSLDETGFEVERRRGAGSGSSSSAAGPWQRIATVGAEVTRYADEHLAGPKKYEYRVRALGAAGHSGSSNPAEAKTPKVVQKGQAPFGGGGSPARVPGVIEAEAFDEGAKGKAWKDRTPENDHAAFRDTGVDVDHTTDPAGGAYHVAAAKGEWLEYTVDVPAAGVYTLELRLAAAAGFGGAAHLDADGRRATLGGSFALPATGGWTTWQTAAGAVNLKAGLQVLRLTFDSAADASGDVAHVNWLRLAPAEASAAASASAPAKKANLKPLARTPRVFESVFNASTRIKAA